MKRHSVIAILALLITTIIACNNKAGEPEPVKSKESETVQYLTPKQKSIHLFNLPEGVSEEQFMTAISETNSEIGELGYSGVGYHVYKVGNDSIEEYRYFLEGLWPDAETYRIIHEDEKWKLAIEKHKEIFEKIKAGEIYRKMLKVEIKQ